MNDAVTAFISGFIIILSEAVFYVLWDNSCKKFHEFEKHIIELINAQTKWMDAIEESLIDNNKIYDIKKLRKEFETHKMELKNCERRP